jgi:hypothetical protein
MVPLFTGNAAIVSQKLQPFPDFSDSAFQLLTGCFLLELAFPHEVN